jgi:hypothetical protein
MLTSTFNDSFVGFQNLWRITYINESCNYLRVSYWVFSSFPSLSGFLYLAALSTTRQDQVNKVKRRRE